jgi:hypothetical protein
MPQIPGFGEDAAEQSMPPDLGPSLWHHSAYGPEHEITHDHLMVPNWYGAADDAAPTKRGPGRRVVLVLGLLGAVCVTTYCFGAWTDPPARVDSAAASRRQAAGGQTVIGSGCGLFLCPHSGRCVRVSSQCPEGDPFLLRRSIYLRLARCERERPQARGAGGQAARAWPDGGCLGQRADDIEFRPWGPSATAGPPHPRPARAAARRRPCRPSCCARAAEWGAAQAAVRSYARATARVWCRPVSQTRSPPAPSCGWSPHSAPAHHRFRPAPPFPAIVSSVSTLISHEVTFRHRHVISTSAPACRQTPGGVRAEARSPTRRPCTTRSPPPPPSRTKWTRRVPHPVLIGHAASLTPSLTPSVYHQEALEALAAFGGFRDDGARRGAGAAPKAAGGRAPALGQGPTDEAWGGTWRHRGASSFAGVPVSSLPPVLSGHVSSLPPY